MKISQEVREFARLQNQDGTAFIAAQVSPIMGEGKLAFGEQSEDSRIDKKEADIAEKGMAAMSETFKEKGAELYLPTK